MGDCFPKKELFYICMPNGKAVFLIMSQGNFLSVEVYGNNNNSNNNNNSSTYSLLSTYLVFARPVLST